MKINNLKITTLSVGVSLLFSTFLIGVVVTLLWLKISPPVLSLCEVAKDPKKYQGKTVRLKAFVQTIHGIFLFQDKSCSFRSFDAAIYLPENYTPDSEPLRNFISKDNDEYLSTQMIITGEIDTTTIYEDNAPKFGIKANEIFLISEIAIEPENKQIEMFLKNQ